MDGKSSPTSDLATQVAQAVQERLGAASPRVRDIVAQEVEAVLGNGPVPNETISLSRPDGTSRVVVTSHGRNRTGIIAAMAKAIDEFRGDIRDMSQTIVGDYFTVLFVVDISQAAPDSAPFMQLKHRLQEVGTDLGIQVMVMHDDILSTMHSI